MGTRIVLVMLDILLLIHINSFISSFALKSINKAKSVKTKALQ